MNASRNNDKQQLNNKNLRQKWPLLVGLLVLGLLLAGGYWRLFKSHREATDDAYVMADSARISSRIPGTVLRVLVENDRPVRTGQVLLELDSRACRVEVERARAGLVRIDADIQAAAVNVPLTDTVTGSQLQTGEAVVQASKDKEHELRARRQASVGDRQKVEFEQYQLVASNSGYLPALFRFLAMVTQ